MIDQFLLVLVVCILFAYLLKKNNKRLPPGPIQLPVLGSTIQLYQANPHYPHLALSKLAEKYGDIMSFGFGMHPAGMGKFLRLILKCSCSLLKTHIIIYDDSYHTSLIVSSFELMKEVFKRIDNNSHRFEFPYVFDRNYGKNLGIIWSHGQEWIDVRRFTKKILKEFGYGKIKTMDQSLAESANQLVDGIKMELMDSPDGSFTVQSRKFSIHVVNVLWNMVGGYKFDPSDELLKRNMDCVEKVEEIAGHSNQYNMFPFLKTWFPNYVRYPEHLKIHQEIHDFTKILINDAMERRNQRLDSEQTSFIEVFLDKIEDQDGNPDTIYSYEQLHIILEDLFFGGLITTGTLLAWSLLYLVQNPDIQLKLRKEIRNKMKDRSDVFQSIELKKIPYLKATVLEILRLGNIAPVPLPRRNTQDFEIEGYVIPKGTVLFYNLYSMYNDKNYWKDPENFRPERYINEYGEIDQSRSERILNSVFGVGSRVCFGETIALDSLFMFFAAMIINFKFESIPGREPSADNPHNGLCLCPRTYCVKVTTEPI